VASWLIFYVAHSLRIDSDMLVVRALKISQLTDGGMSPTYDSMHWCPVPEIGTSFVAIKMGRRSCLGRTIRAGLPAGGRIPEKEIVL
jgi:hypothetical protein